MTGSDRSTGSGRLSDEALARTAREDPYGELGRRAAAELFGRYNQRIYIWCFRYVHDNDRALDLAQDVVLSALRNIGSYNGRSRFFSWIFTIARNRCLNAVRKPPLLFEADTDVEALADPSGDPIRLLEERSNRAVIEEAIRGLDETEQEAIRLRCFERLPVEEITTILEIEEASGARGVLQRARRKLRLALDRPAPAGGSNAARASVDRELRMRKGSETE